jgi:dTDP-4-dehydrorhamnose reductase
MRILITGTQGQLALALSERAQAKGHVVALFGRPRVDLAADPDVISNAVVGAAKAFVADAIINAAAYTAVDKAETEPGVAFAINSQGAGAVAMGAAHLGIPILHVSTDYVFDGSRSGPWQEEDSTAPLSVYGHSKRAGEEAVRAAARDHAIFRTSWVYSPFGVNFVKTMLRLAAEGREQLNIVNDQVGAPTSALDIADGLLSAAACLTDQPAKASLRGTFHMTAQGVTNWAEFAATIFAISREHGGPSATVVPIASVDYPTPAARPKNSILSNKKLAENYGFRLPAWREALQPVVVRLLAKDKTTSKEG